MSLSTVATHRMRPHAGVRRPTKSEEERVALRAPIPEARGVGQMLDATVQHYVEHFVPLTTIALLIAFPFQIIYHAIAYSDIGGSSSPFPELAWSLLTVPAQIAVNAFAFAIVGGALSGRPRGPLEAAGLALKKLPALLFVFFLTAFVALMTCGVGGVLTTWLFGPAIGLVVLEDVPVKNIVSRTFDLASGWGSFGRWIGIYFVTSLVLGGLAAVDVALNTPEVRSSVLSKVPLGSSALDVLLPLLSASVMALQMALNGVSLVVFYLDLCVRRAGLDLSRRLDRLEAGRAERVLA